MLSINTNTPAFTAQNSLKKATLKLNTAIERMSSGFKINHAADNAANYSISTDMGVKLSSYDMAQDNVAMGLDLVTTVSDTMDLLSDHLTRLRALAEQAANGTYGKESIKAVNSEARAIVDEIYRIKNTASYNGLKIFGDTTIDEQSVGAKGLVVNEDGFLQDIEKRDTSAMTKMSDVDENAVLAKGTYSISSAEELAKLAKMQNAGKVEAGSEFVLASDIDLSKYQDGEGWTPIGADTNRSFGTTNGFAGIFDGNGYKISNLYINRPLDRDENQAAGLFATTKGATIKNLGIANVNIKGGNDVAPLVAHSAIRTTLTVSNCWASNIHVEADLVASGLVGICEQGTIKMDSCYSDYGEIISNSDGSGIVAGCLGCDVSNCFSTVNIHAGSYIGGLVGFAFDDSGSSKADVDGKISNCYYTGNINDLGKEPGISVGGIAGRFRGEVTNCFTTGDISTQGTVGGIIGNCGSGEVIAKNCFSTGNIFGEAGSAGIVGAQDMHNGGLVENCYVTGEISSSSTENLGIFTGATIDTATIRNCGYNGSLNKNVTFTGGEKGTCENIYEINFNADFQVGIHGNQDSQVNMSSLAVLGGLDALVDRGVNSKSALSTIDTFINTFSAKQVEYGAIQNRLESALDEISTQTENLTSSRSTLRDADIAEVSSEYIKQQILQQASATLMATANQTPALALQLL